MEPSDVVDVKASSTQEIKVSSLQYDTAENSEGVSTTESVITEQGMCTASLVDDYASLDSSDSPAVLGGASFAALGLRDLGSLPRLGFSGASFQSRPICIRRQRREHGDCGVVPRPWPL